jgi:glycosyltransferase involved in cell wall biosynthesis
MISIVTATYNCVTQLPGLIGSLRAQTDKRFEWIVSDGGSTDGTLELLRSASDLPLSLSSQPDFGIYDALNRALHAARGDYYIVAGADDAFAPDAVARYCAAITEQGAEHGADLIVARVSCGPHEFGIKKGASWIVGEKAFIGNHSIGTAFRLALHQRFGFYSRKFPIGADSLFVLQACKGGATRRELDYVAGEIGPVGVSAQDWAGAATELFRAQLIVGESLILQTLLLLLRIVKGGSRGVRALHDAMFR